MKRWIKKTGLTGSFLWGCTLQRAREILDKKNENALKVTAMLRNFGLIRTKPNTKVDGRLRLEDPSDRKKY